ncbi:MAG: hypothetical protein OXC28_06805 [Defluviicoccus sp.]|nr:hypothetical protein [Defluviicoccus sp.]
MSRLEVDTVELGCYGVAGAFRYQAANGETAMATGGQYLLPAVRAADVPDRALP